MARCLITGCRLIDATHGRHVWGDLHSCGDAIFVFNAVRAYEDEAAWEYVPLQPQAVTQGERAVTLQAGADSFERRGIITFAATDAELNEVAKRYLGDR